MKPRVYLEAAALPFQLGALPHQMTLPMFMLKILPKGSYVVPFWVCYGFFLVRDYNILPKKELHRRVWLEAELAWP